MQTRRACGADSKIASPISKVKIRSAWNVAAIEIGTNIKAAEKPKKGYSEQGSRGDFT